jgi:galactose oxidase
MTSLGNAWHVPTAAEPYRRAGMRDPVGAVAAGAAVDIFVGNQFQDPASPLLPAKGGPVLPDLGGGVAAKGSEVHYRFRHAGQADWTSWRQVPLVAYSRGQTNGECDTTGACSSTLKEHLTCVAADENKNRVLSADAEYYVGRMPAGTFAAGDSVEYCICVHFASDATDDTWVLAKDGGSATTGKQEDALDSPFRFTVGANSALGLWGDVIKLRNVAVHAHVLPTGKVLIWGRRDRETQTIHTHECTPFLWDPEHPGEGTEVKLTPQPTLGDGKTKVNLFCSGHTFLPDGRLLVVGGHLFDGEGIQQATIYDFATNTWRATNLMNDGRWYPTATSLPDGDVLVTSGSVAEEHSLNAVPQVWRDGRWIDLHGPVEPGPTLPAVQSFALFPRIHVSSTGLLCMVGSLAATWMLDVSTANGTWKRIAGSGRSNGSRDYCPSVMYAVDKIIYIGGGNDVESHAPTASAETIDLKAETVRWTSARDMSFRRRHHNATILPDGTVLVTGGTRGGGGPGDGFNDLTRGKPVHIAELWDPDTTLWTQLAAEQVDRCYHATAVLLPDATVLSAGSGEYAPWPKSAEENFREDNHRNGQIFSPPYLFKGGGRAGRPVITQAPDSVNYGDTFTLQTPAADKIRKISLVRLSSVTHAFNMNQHINFLTAEPAATGLLVTAPVSRNECPPGHYMLFILDADGVPSVAKIIRVGPAYPARDTYASGAAAGDKSLRSAAPPGEDALFMTSVEQSIAVLAAPDRGTRVVVGVTGRCPYGIGACWGGAEEALRGLEGVRYVDPIPDLGDSTAQVFLEDDRLPAVGGWGAQFTKVANGSYDFRGAEVSLEGAVEARGNKLVLTTPKGPVQLAALPASRKVQWDLSAGGPRALETGEASAYDDLAREARAATTVRRATVTGPLEQPTHDTYVLHVRRVHA